VVVATTTCWDNRRGVSIAINFKSLFEYFLDLVVVGWQSAQQLNAQKVEGAR